jgi:hypothetical protein
MLECDESTPARRTSRTRRAPTRRFARWWFAKKGWVRPRRGFVGFSRRERVRSISVNSWLRALRVRTRDDDDDGDD